MRKIIALLHVSLDGFATNANGEMNWIKFDEELFDFVGKLTDNADTALYGRITYEMMDAYWPGAADKPNATKHDIEHSEWYNNVNKVIVSGSMKGTEKNKTTFIGDNVTEAIKELKQQEGGNILLLGSPSVLRLLTKHNIIDEYLLFVNPVLLGNGIAAYPENIEMTTLEPVAPTTFNCGVTLLQFTKK
ncbi:dihydrofolate reductase family protein [Flavobacterium rhizosphaerae]|uniref:Dihydrofolate reductase family protein n=1 Tax=Flavobacterium rhizosphaerae TaxID=3163298 RepID=A0ABW8YUK3_9FLAO